MSGEEMTRGSAITVLVLVIVLFGIGIYTTIRPEHGPDTSECWEAKRVAAESADNPDLYEQALKDAVTACTP